MPRARQRDPASVIRTGLHPGKLYAAIGLAEKNRALVSDHIAGEGCQDRSEGREALQIHHLPTRRGRSVQEALCSYPGEDSAPPLDAGLWMSHNDRPVTGLNRSPRQTGWNREKHNRLSAEKQNNAENLCQGPIETLCQRRIESAIGRFCLPKTLVMAELEVVSKPRLDALTSSPNPLFKGFLKTPRLTGRGFEMASNRKATSNGKSRFYSVLIALGVWADGFVCKWSSDK